MIRKITSRLFGGGSPVGSPSRALRNISQDIQNYLDSDLSIEQMTDEIEGLTEGLGEKEARLFEYCEQQPEIKKILEEFQVPLENFEKLYHELASVGALQWASGHLIAASALAYPSTLRYLLNNWQIDLEHNIIMGDGSKQRMAYSLIMYFKRGEALD